MDKGLHRAHWANNQWQTLSVSSRVASKLGALPAAGGLTGFGCWCVALANLAGLPHAAALTGPAAPLTEVVTVADNISMALAMALDGTTVDNVVKLPVSVS